MSDSNRFLKQRTRSTFLTSLLIISLVLLVLGVFGFISLYVNVYLEEQQEEIAMIVVLPKNISEAQQDSVQKVFEARAFSKSVQSVTAEEARADFIDHVGEDFMKVMGNENPMHPTLEIKLNSDYISPTSIQQIKKEFIAEMRSTIVVHCLRCFRMSQIFLSQCCCLKIQKWSGLASRRTKNIVHGRTPAS